MKIVIKRYARINYPSGGVMRSRLGDLIDTYEWYADAIPRVGEHVTVHPDLEITEKSWTGQVTGVHHVFSRGTPHVITVMDGGAT